MVTKPTRGQNILDVFLTNRPHVWKTSITVFVSLVRSDHLAVIISPAKLTKPVRKLVSFRDAREHRKRDMYRRLEEKDWSFLLDMTIDDMALQFEENLKSLFDECFPEITIKTSSRDPPFMSPLVKHLCKERNRNIKKDGYLKDTDLQERINNLIRENQVRAVYEENSKHKTGSKVWWDTVNKITGRKTKPSIPTSIQPDAINSYFQQINTDDDYRVPDNLPLPAHTRIPTVDVSTVQMHLSRLRRTAAGPDQLPYWFWKDFNEQLAPVVTCIFNKSLKQHKVPSSWKIADITPVPKEAQVNDCTQLRPISITNIIARLCERVVYETEISDHFMNVIGQDQFAFKKGSNTTAALLKCQDFWLKALDNHADYVRILSFDFSKAFDTVSHYILCEKLKTTGLNPYIINWITNFLTDRKQRVIVHGENTSFVDITRGVPQGTVLGPILFSLMVNDIAAVKPETNLLVKFADDITVCAPVSKSIDTALTESNNISSWAVENRMTLSLPKTWEMTVHGNTKKETPPLIPGIKRRDWLKLLGITFQENPNNWDMHIDNLLAKASSRLYILRVCKGYGYCKEHLDKLFDSLIVSLFLYGIEVWGAAQQQKYVDRFNRFFKRSFKYGYTSSLKSIKDIITQRDQVLFDKICMDDHILNVLLPAKRSRTNTRERKHNYILPKVKTERYKRSFINRCLFR